MRWTAEQYREFTMQEKPPAKKDRMNKLERRFHDYLLAAKNDLVSIRYESLKLRLADKTWYTPDFFALMDVGPCLIEVKGFWRDDARVKIKVAAELYPEFNFAAVQWKGGQWRWEWF